MPPSLPTLARGKPASIGRGFSVRPATANRPSAGILTKWTDDGPRLVWHVKAGWGYAAPAISRGRLFLFEADRKQVRLRCLNSETGKPVWDSDFSFPNDYHDTFGIADNGPRSSPIVDEDRVYCIGPDGMLYCRQRAQPQGALVARHVRQVPRGAKLLRRRQHAGDRRRSADPADRRQPGRLASQRRPDQLGEIKGAGSGIVALDKLTGAVKYQVTDELASYASPTLATINGRRWGFVFARGGLIGFDAGHGQSRFRVSLAGEEALQCQRRDPVVVGDTVFISESYGPGSALLRREAGRLRHVWKDPDGPSRSKAMALHWNTPIALGGYLFGSSGRQTKTPSCAAIELATGKVKWSQPDLGRSSLLYVDGHFICLCESGRLLLLRPTPRNTM